MKSKRILPTLIFLFSFIFSSDTLYAQVKKLAKVDTLGEQDESPIIPKEIKQRHFNYKGFSLVINDETSDENGNHMLVGKIRAIETDENKRDSVVNRLFNLKGYATDGPLGFIILADKSYSNIRIAPSYVGEKVVYDKTKKQFTIGANDFAYLHVGDKSFSAWQPVIIQTNLKLESSAYFISKNYSCILKDMVVKGDDITVFTRSDNKREGDKNAEKAEVITVTPNKFHLDSARYRMVMDVLFEVATPYNDIGRMTISEVSVTDSAFYFTTSNLDQFALKTSNHLYRYENKILTEIPAFEEYLKWNNHNSDWININDFYVNANKNYLFLTHIGASKKEITFSKTDAGFNVLQSKKIPLDDYADFNRMLILSNGNITMLSLNDRGTWIYIVYNSDLQYIKEFDSTVSKKYYPTQLKELDGGLIECLFFINNTNKKDCLIQEINVE